MTENGPGLDEALFFNGINAASGGYLLGGLSTADLAEVARGASADPEAIEALRQKVEVLSEQHFGTIEGVDSSAIEAAGWGIAFPRVKPGTDEDKLHDDILAALEPLIARRRSQAGARFKICRHNLGIPVGTGKGARAEVNAFLTSHGLGPGPIDPKKLPYYLLLIADPAVVPYEVQYLLDVQGAVGRLWFGAVAPYAAYARSVVEAEGRDTSAEALGVGLFGVRNADDPATQLSAQHLISGLQSHLSARPENPLRSSLIGPEATKGALHSLLHGGEVPGLLFTASHGMGFPSGHALQRRHQGALLCQDWPGPRLWKEAIPTDHYLSADDIAEDADLCGRVIFSFACYGAGTPQKDDFFRRTRDPVRADIAPSAFQAELPLRLLGRDKGALAFIGHVERAWGYSFLWCGVGRASGGVGDALITTFTSTVDALLAGKPVGVAMDVFNLKYAQFATWLTAELEEIDFGRAVDPAALVELWTCHNDARDTVIIGDPAVCLGGVAAGSFTPQVVERPVETLHVPTPTRIAESVAPPAFSAPSAPSAPTGRVVRTWVAPDLSRVEAGSPLPVGARLVATTHIGEDGAVDHVIGEPAPDAEVFARHLQAVGQKAYAPRR